MSVELPDVSVLLAIAWPAHLYHRRARQWLQEACLTGWATCPFTQAGFVRLSSNPAFTRAAVRPGDAIELLRSLTKSGGHEFWPDDVNLTLELPEPFHTIMGHRQVADAYLLALAAHHGGRLVTLDRAIPEMVAATSLYRDAVTVLDYE